MKHVISSKASSHERNTSNDVVRLMLEAFAARVTAEAWLRHGSRKQAILENCVLINMLWMIASRPTTRAMSKQDDRSFVVAEAHVIVLDPYHQVVLVFKSLGAGQHLCTHFRGFLVTGKVLQNQKTKNRQSILGTS